MNMKTTFRFDGDKVHICLPFGERHITTAATAEVLGIDGDRDIVGLHPDTMVKLLSYARDREPLRHYNQVAHATYHGLYPSESDSVRLNVGGMGYQFPRRFLMDHFRYFRTMLTYFKEARQEDDIFIDRDYRRFDKAICYAHDPFDTFVNESTRNELMFYGYDKPLLTITAADMKNAYTSSKDNTDKTWSQVQEELRRVYKNVQSGKVPESRATIYLTSDIDKIQKDDLTARLKPLGFETKWNTTSSRIIDIKW